MEQKDGEAAQKLQSLTEKLTTLRHENIDLVQHKKDIESLLSIETEKRANAEEEMAQMRDQLLANANLLASPALSRVGSTNAFSDYLFIQLCSYFHVKHIA
ncbi:unnamed protein product [Anisakis simplex]|uniref:HOOK domain-containing protein n=1 Tax=Anisakis simplex TaxID=6269 RepID=A0A0M3JCE7_ANISI|nr:unnamed protein product [Anisakis simplex]